MIKIEDLIEDKDKVYYLIQPQNSTEIRTAIDIDDVKTLLKDYTKILLKEVVSNIELKTETYSNPDESNWEKVVDENSVLNLIDKINFD